MRVERIAAAVAACTGAAVLAAGCGSSSDGGSATASSSGKLKSVTMINPAPGQPAWDAIVKCFKSEAAAQGVKAIVNGPPGASAYNPTALRQLTEQAIDRGTSAIAINTSFSAPSFDALIKQAKAKGMYVGTLESGEANAGRDFDVGLDITGYAKKAAEFIGKMSGPKNVAVVAQAPVGTPKIFIDALKQALTRYPGAKYVSQVYNNGDATKDADLVANLLSAHPETSIIVSGNPASTAGIATAIREAKAIGKVRLLAVTRDEAGLAALKEGTAAALYVQHLCDVGTKAVQSFVALSKGQRVSKLQAVGTGYATEANNSTFDASWG